MIYKDTFTYACLKKVSGQIGKVSDLKLLEKVVPVPMLLI